MHAIEKNTPNCLSTGAMRRPAMLVFMAAVGSDCIAAAAVEKQKQTRTHALTHARTLALFMARKFAPVLRPSPRVYLIREAICFRLSPLV